MVKNKIGGKHKHLKKSDGDEKFILLGVNDEIEYAYVTKAYGNRAFDAILIKSLKTVRFQAQYKKRKHRVTVGGLIHLALAKDFTNQYYVVENICGPEEIKCVEKSEHYKDNYRMIRQQNDMTYNSNNQDTFDFDKDDDQDDDQEYEKPSISYGEAVEISDNESDDSELDIDNL